MGEISINPKFNIHETYKKVRILNPYRGVSAGGGGGVDPDYQAVLDYAAGNFIALPNAAQQDIDNQLIINYKASGGWDKDDVVFNPRGTATPAFKLICWKRRVEMIAVGGLTWDEFGVKGNGTNAYIKTGFNPTVNGVNYTVNDAGVNYVGVNAPMTKGCLIGGYDGALSSFTIWAPYNYQNNKAIYGVNGFNDTVLTADNVMKAGLNGIYRIDNITLKNVGLGELTTNTATANLLNAEIYILARNINNAPSIYWDEKISFLTIGGNKYSMHNAMASVLE